MREGSPAVLGALLEGAFDEARHPRDPRGRWTVGDHVTLQHGEGGGAHVLAPVGHVKLNTPAQHAAAQQRQQRSQQRDAQRQHQARAAWLAAKPAGPVREAFSIGGAAPRETPAQSAVLGARQVKQAQSSLRAGWNPSKHPRSGGGKFGYTTGGKRATRSPSGSRTLSTGSSGALVKSVQQRVGVTSDGRYGPQTHGAVARYQQQHGLQVDGVVGAQTIAALRGHPNPQRVKPGPIPSRTARLRQHPATRKPGTASPSARTRTPARASRAQPGAAKVPVRVGGGIVV